MVFKTTKGTYFGFFIIIYLAPLIILVIGDVKDNDYLLISGISSTLIYAYALLYLKSFKIIIDEEYLKYHAFRKEKVIPLKSIKKARYSSVIVRKGIIFKIKVYTTSLKKPELEINAGLLNHKEVKEILKVLNNANQEDKAALN